MRERMNNIMSVVKSLQPLYFLDYSELSEDKFLIKTTYPECRTILQWEATAFLTIEVVHILGYLEANESIPSDVIGMLKWNFDSETGRFYGLYYDENTDIVHVSQSMSNIFLPKWSDEDIEDVIAAILSRIEGGKIFGFPKPIIAYDMKSTFDYSQLSSSEKENPE